MKLMCFFKLSNINKPISAHWPMEHVQNETTGEQNEEIG